LGTRPALPGRRIDERELLSYYSCLRTQYQPARVQVLLIGEAPPPATEWPPPFFYAPNLGPYDQLFRAVAAALYPRMDPSRKTLVLEQLRSDGIWLLDAVELPIEGKRRSDHQRAIDTERSRLLKRCLNAAPSKGAIICHALVYDRAANALREGGLHLLHTAAIPFPSRRWPSHQARFHDEVRRAVSLARTECS